MSSRSSRRAGGAADVLREIARAGRPAVSASVTVHGTHVVTSPGAGRPRARPRRAAAPARQERVASSMRRSPTSGLRSSIRPHAAPRRRPSCCSPHPVRIDYHGARLGALTPVQLSHALRVQAAHAPLRGRLRSGHARDCGAPAARPLDPPRAQRAVRRRGRPRARRSVEARARRRSVAGRRGRDQGRARRRASRTSSSAIATPS